MWPGRLLEISEVSPGFPSNGFQKHPSSDCPRDNAKMAQRVEDIADHWFSECSVKAFPWHIVQIG